MHPDTSPDRCIRLCVTISNQLKGFYYCALERSNVLLGLEMNGSSPEYVISLEIFDIKKDKGRSIKFTNDGLEIVMQFDDENKCNYWLTSFLNAQTSVYSYIPVSKLYQEDTQDSYSVLKIPPKPGKLSTSCIPIKFSYNDLLHNSDFTEITERQHFNSTRKMSSSTDSVFFDALSISNFEGLKNQYSKTINKSTDELNSTRKVIQKAKSRTLPNSSKKGNIKIRKDPFPEIRFEDHVAKFRHPQIEITDSENLTNSKMKSKNLPENRVQNIKSIPPNLKKVENVILERYKMKQFERDKLVVFLNFN